MNKSTRILKRLLALFLVVLMSINSFGAVVSDNDGSAFITKAEFDSLKNDFQSQIDQYNTSIDAKIDGAIASYLAGISVDRDPINLYERVMNNTGGHFRFVNHSPGAGSPTLQTDFTLTVNNYISRYLDIVYAGVASRGSAVGFDYGLLAAKSWNELDRIVGATKSSGSSAWWSFTSWNRDTPAKKSQLTQRRDNFMDVTTQNTAGSGTAWVYHVNPNGSQTLQTYNTSIYPMQDVVVNRFRYKNFSTKAETSSNTNFITYYTTANGMNMTTSKTQTITAMTDYRTVSGGTSVNPSTATTADTVWYTHKLLKVQVDDGVDYSLFQWGGDKSKDNIYVLSDTQKPVENTAVTKSATNSTKTELYFPYTGVDTRNITFSGVAVTYTPVELKPTLKVRSSFSNNYLSSVADEIVYIGNGAPLFETEDDDQTVKVNLHAFLTNADGTRITGEINVMISDKKFVQGEFDTTATLRVTKTYTISDITGYDIDVDVDCQSAGLYWINAYPSNGGDLLGFEDPSFKLK